MKIVTTGSDYTDQEKAAFHKKVTSFITSFRSGDSHELLLAIAKQARDITQELLEETMTSSDFLFLGALNKMCSLVHPFLYSFQTNNLPVCALLCRSIVDLTITLYAMNCVEQPHQYALGIGLKGKDFHDYGLSFSRLAQDLGTLIGFPVKDLYQKLCAYDHCSSRAFLDAANAEEKDGEMRISFNLNIAENYSDKYAKLCSEIAEQFYVFGKIVLDLILPSWLHEKENRASSD